MLKTVLNMLQPPFNGCLFNTSLQVSYNRRPIALECRYIYRYIEEPGRCSRYSDWLRAGRPRGQSSSPGRAKNFLFSKSSRPAPGSTQPIQWVPGVKRPGREADHSPPTSAEVKKMWIYKPTPPYTFMAQCLIS
jgi:hypothetical protein